MGASCVALRCVALRCVARGGHGDSPPLVACEALPTLLLLLRHAGSRREGHQRQGLCRAVGAVFGDFACGWLARCRQHVAREQAGGVQRRSDTAAPACSCCWSPRGGGGGPAPPVAAPPSVDLHPALHPLPCPSLNHVSCVGACSSLALTPPSSSPCSTPPPPGATLMRWEGEVCKGGRGWVGEGRGWVTGDEGGGA